MLFGDQGSELVAYEIDGFYDAFGVVLEVEAGRGHLGNAPSESRQDSSNRRSENLAIGMCLKYRYKAKQMELKSADYVLGTQ